MNRENLLDMFVTVPESASDEDIADFLRDIATEVEAGSRRGKRCGGGYRWKLEE